MNSAAVTRDAALAACGCEMMQSKGTSGKVAKRRQSITDAGLLGKEVESRNCSGSSVIGAFKYKWVGVNYCELEAEGDKKRLSPPDGNEEPLRAQQHFPIS